MAKLVAVLPLEMEAVAQDEGLLAGPSASAPHLAAIRQAIRAEHGLHLRYTDKKRTATERTVWPVAVGFFDAVEVLAAWCETRRDFRHFRLDRIAAAEPTGTRFPARRRVLLAEWRLRQDTDER